MNQQENSFNILWGKTYAACGDSFTHGDFTGLDESEWYIRDGMYRGERRVYPFLIGARNNMRVINSAVNGCTMADKEGRDADHVFVREAYQNIPADADYITLCFGINDWHQEIPLGSPEGTDPFTFYGAWNTVMEYLLEHHTYAKIGIIVTNGIGEVGTYTEAERVIARRWGIPYLDMQADPRVPLMHRVADRPELCEKAKEIRLRAFRVSETNTHPNPQAHEYESTFIEHFLRSL